MERKIGEIFEYNGEWYQCVIPTDGCDGCSFRRPNRCAGKVECIAHRRSDHKSVIFKKLEKVGEPYMTGNKLIQRYKIYPTTCCINVYGWYYQNLDVKSWTIDIEIKQNKEDMEEKKQKLDKLVEDYSYNRISYEVFDNCLKQLYADKQRIKPFNLEAAKAGKPVCTRDGRKARIVCFNRNAAEYHIIALIECKGFPNKEEEIKVYTNDGKYLTDEENSYDLMMLPEKKEGWAKVRKNINLYDTKEEADRKMIRNDEYVTAKVFWEE